MLWSSGLGSPSVRFAQKHEGNCFVEGEERAIILPNRRTILGGRVGGRTEWCPWEEGRGERHFGSKADQPAGFLGSRMASGRR